MGLRAAGGAPGQPGAPSFGHGLMPNYAAEPSPASGDAVRSALSAGDDVDEPWAATKTTDRRTDGRTDGRTLLPFHRLMRTHPIEPRASQISRTYFVFKCRQHT